MIFITVGSRDFQFNRLLRAVDEAVEKGRITDEIFAQVGSSTYAVKSFNTVDYLNHDEFNSKLKECDIVLTHGGTGVIVNSVKLGKRVVAVPRLVQYNEVVDDHQMQLVGAFEKLGMVTGCYDCNNIAEAIQAAREKEVTPFKSNTENVIKSIDEVIRNLIGEQSSEREDKIRVLMCSSDRKEKGGMNSVIDQLMEHQWGEAFQFSYLATHVTGNPIKKTLFFFRAYFKLVYLLKKNTFDIIHIHMSYKGSFYRKYYVAKLCKKNKKKVIVHLHGSEFKDFYNNGDEKLKRRIRELFSNVDYSIVLGNDWKDFIKQIAPNSKVSVINNAVKIPDITEKEENKIPTLLFLGALIKRKGVEDLFEAINKIKMCGSNHIKVLIAGSGVEENALKEYVIKHSLQDMVEFLGWVNNEQKIRLLLKSDVLVLPSYNEGLPIAILEALSYGLPVISTNVGSIAEAVVDDYNGYLFTPGAVEQLGTYIKKIVQDRNLLSELSYNSRTIAKAKFAEDVFFDKVAKLYFELGGKGT